MTGDAQSRVAVILFPGTNCEEETIRALRRVGLKAELVRWNEEVDLGSFDGYVFPGGFSFEDRGRSGLVASFEPIVDAVMEQAKKGKLVVGICNGCQILVDRGFVPGGEKVAMGWNVRLVDDKVQGRWVSRTPYMKMSGKMAADFGDEVVMKAPVAHGEGRFAALNSDIFEELEKNGQIVLQYCDAEGNVASDYPTNPNGAPKAIAGLCNVEGNIVAFMPHPERVYPQPGYEQSDKVFEWMREKLKSKNEKVKKTDLESSLKTSTDMVYDGQPEVDLEVLTELMITDNEAWTIEQVARRVLGIGLDDDGFGLRKAVWWGIEKVKIKKENLKMDKEKFKNDFALEIIQTDELANLNKERVVVIFDGKKFEYLKVDKGLREIGDDHSASRLLVLEREDTIGTGKMAVFADHHADLGIEKMSRGVVWTVEGCDEAGIEKLVSAGVFHNAASMKVTKY